MISGKRLQVVQALSDSKYESFLAECDKQGVVPLSLNEYCQKAGILRVAIDTYGEVDVKDSYLKMVQDINKADAERDAAGESCCGEEKKSPPLVTKIKNFAQASFEHAKSGRPQTSDEEYKRRLSICLKCDKIINNLECSECGCHMWLKARWAEQPCKLNKW
jgi:hypothetical protein